MGQSIMERIQARLELFRLEKRYTRRRDRRSTFVSNAVYVDGEYVYQTPNSTGSSADSSTSRIDALHGERPSPATRYTQETESSEYTSPMVDEFPAADRKRLNRFSSFSGFGMKDQQPKTTLQRRTSMFR